MSPDSPLRDLLVRDLLLQWENLRKEGRTISVEELCRDCPDLIQTVQQKIKALETVDRMLDSGSGLARGTLKPLGPDDFALRPPSADREPTIDAPLSPPPIDAPRPSSSPELKAGAEPVPGYTLVSLLGRGGFGEVWKATAPGGFPIAMKFVSSVGHGVEVEMRALEIIKSIRHPNLLATFGAWQISGWVVIAMELADQTLSDRFDQARAQGLPGIPRDELLEYLQEAAKGIDYLNEPQQASDGKPGLGVQHRDIKPHNILLVGRGVKVADFGLARLLEHALTAHTGSLTPAYAAPEFMRGQTSNRSDQYSLAVTYCELRGGRLPFEGHLEQVLCGHLERAPDLSMLPSEEQPAVERALAKNPADRWPTCRSFVAALARAAHEPPAATPNQKRSVAGAHGRWRSFSRLALAGLCGVLIWAVFVPHGETPPDLPPSNRKQAKARVVAPEITVPENNTPEITITKTDVPSLAAESNVIPNPTGQPATESAIEIATKPDEIANKTVVPETTPSAAPAAETTQSPKVPPAEASTVPIATAPAAAPATAPPDIRIGADAPVRTDVPVGTDVRVGELLRFSGHDGGVRAVAVSTDNRHVLSAGDDHSVRLWDIETGAEIHRFAEHQAAVHCVAFSPDGLKAISGDENHAVWLWDIAGKSKIRPLIGHTEAVYSVAFSADGARAVSAGKDTTVRVWNVETGAQLHRIEGPDESIWSVVFGPDDRHILVASDANVVRIYSPESSTPVQRLVGHADVVWSVACSKKTRHAVTAGGDARENRDFSVRLWDVDRGQELHRFDGHQGAVGSVAISPDGRRALSGSVDKTVRLWDLETRRELHSFTDHADIVQSVAFAPDGLRALSTSRDGTVRVWALPK